jgi:hypothetical protein
LLSNPKFGLLLSLLLAGGMWFYVQHVLIAYQRADAAAHDRPRGNLSDLYPRWLGARELLLHHRDPYSAELTREIQTGYYGRPLDPRRASDPKDQQGFAYPLYVVFLLAPTITLPFSAVQIGFRWFLIALTAATVPLWLRALGWRPSKITLAILTILTLGSFPAVQGIKLQQLTLLVSGLLAGCAALLAAGHLLLAGVLLALATIKPQLALPLAAWLLQWSLSDWRNRQRLFWGFAATMAALLAGAQYVLPGWIPRFLDALAAYRDYTQGALSVLDLLTNAILGRILTALVLLGLVAVCWRMRRTPADSDRFALVGALVLAATIVVIPMFAPYNQLLLLPAIFLLVQHRSILWGKSVPLRLAVSVAALMVFWPWLVALALAAVSLVLPPESVQRAWFVPFYTSNAIPVAVLALFAFLMRRLQHPT